MGNHVSAVDVDPQQLAQAYNFWKRFTSFMAVGAVAVAVLLALMALFLV
ncbi:MAG: aa3-type cytochrome c oxidase subunit IV [Alphaproteobacteria bacterium]|nr:aa3-type cytochrome c oxidase subunit IV [Alphaproteobacteria bacterium]